MNPQQFEKGFILGQVDTSCCIYPYMYICGIVSPQKSGSRMTKQNAAASQVNTPFRGHTFVDAVYHISTISDTFHESRQTHSCQMMRNSVRRELRNCGNLADRTPVTNESPNDLYTIGVTQCFHGCGAFRRVQACGVLRNRCGDRWTATRFTSRSFLPRSVFSAACHVSGAFWRSTYQKRDHSIPKLRPCKSLIPLSTMRRSGHAVLTRHRKEVMQ